MNIRHSMIYAAAFSALAFAAKAQTIQPLMAPTLTFYGNLGITGVNVQTPGLSNSHLPAATVRLGVRYAKYIGVEAEYSGGISDEKLNVTQNGQNVGSINYRLDNQYAGYVVGYWPIAPRIDLLARAGYGNGGLKFSGGGLTLPVSGDTWNVGLGGQLFLSAHDGLRLDYTRATWTNDSSTSFNAVTFSYVRRF